MRILKDATGIKMRSNTSQVFFTIESVEGQDPTTVMSPAKAIKIGQEMIVLAHRVIQLNETVFTSKLE